MGLAWKTVWRQRSSAKFPSSFRLFANMCCVEDGQVYGLGWGRDEERRDCQGCRKIIQEETGRESNDLFGVPFGLMVVKTDGNDEAGKFFCISIYRPFVVCHSIVQGRKPQVGGVATCCKVSTCRPMAPMPGTRQPAFGLP